MFSTAFSAEGARVLTYRPPPAVIRRVVEAQNEKFTATMLNSVEWREAEPGDHLVPRFQAEATKEICSKTTLTIELIVPPWFPLTVGAIEKSGSRVMQSVVNRMVPRFLSQLGKDYRLWASGDESRKPLGDGVL